MRCYFVDFGAARYAVCERSLGDDVVIAHEPATSGFTYEIIERLGKLLNEPGEIDEAQ